MGRLRDAGLSPYFTILYYAISLIPFIAFIALILVGCLSSKAAVTPENLTEPKPSNKEVDSCTL